MVRAKAKVAEQRRLAQKELEENSAPLEIRKSEVRTLSSRHMLPTGEIRNVVAETILRVLPDEFGTEVDEVNAHEHYAHRIVMMLKYGRFDEHGRLKLEGGIPMKDHTYRRVPLCKEHKRT